MNVGQLKRLLQGLQDDTEVVVSGEDGTYDRAHLEDSGTIQAEVSRDGQWMYYFDPAGDMTNPRNQVIDVFWIAGKRY